jgi:hypothetical protein
MVSLSVSFFGDQLNRVNIMGCAVVFSGVFLYKIVFHMEKEAKKEALQSKASLEVGSLIRNEGDNDDDDDYNQSRVHYPARSVELMGRNTGKATAANRAATPKKMTEEALGSDDVSDDDHSSPKIRVV